jgi:mannose-6-phosphate isomerase-like protein (cupin superfamily)
MLKASPLFKATNKCRLAWVNPTTPDLREEQRFDRYPESVVPGPGGTSLHFVTFPPSSVVADAAFDGEAAREEALVRLRGLADHFEKEDQAMHKTNTVDNAVVYDGEIRLELDDAKTVHLKKGDVVVQNGTRHGWRNKGTAPVTMLFFLNGAKQWFLLASRKHSEWCIVTFIGGDRQNTTQ